MIALTSCWNCGQQYQIDAEQCPACNAVNANHDPERAQREVAEKIAGEPRRAELIPEVWQAQKPDAARAWSAVVAMCRGGV